jgi:hypothetical protein
MTRLFATAGAVLLMLQMDWPIAQAQKKYPAGDGCNTCTDFRGWSMCTNIHCPSARPVEAQVEGHTNPRDVYLGQDVLHGMPPQATPTTNPTPMVMPDGIDIIQTVVVHNGFYLSCTNGLIMHAQQTNDNTWWTVYFMEHRAEEGSYWKLITKGEEVWAHDTRRLVQVW